jgi:actin-related protein
LEHGIVTDWDDMERIWQYVYTEGLRTVSEDVSEIRVETAWTREGHKANIRYL